MARDYLAVFGIFNGNHISGFGCTAAATTAAATAGGAAGGGAANLNVDSLFNNDIGVCIYSRTNQCHFAILIAKAERISVDDSVCVVLFQCPSDACRVSRQFVAVKFLSELVNCFYNCFC